MVKTIGNPLSWGAKAVAGAGSTVADAATHLGEETPAEPVVRTITNADLREAVRRGIDDFSAVRSDVIFLVVIYPILGVLLAFGAARGNMLPLVFPLTAGFTLLGPLAGVALYEISRCRERGGLRSAASTCAWPGTCARRRIRCAPRSRRACARPAPGCACCISGARTTSSGRAPRARRWRQTGAITGAARWHTGRCGVPSAAAMRWS